MGLIGFPNVGKSTLLSMISAARPKIANYHFTTLTPVLGVVRVAEEQSFVCADIPGLIEGAAEGVGLGHDFLRHVERCRLLLHVVDVSGSEGRDPKADFAQINHELAAFSAELARRPQIVLGNKCDIAAPEQVEAFRAFIEGMADAVRIANGGFEGPSARPKGGSYMDGYRTTGYFLVWLRDHKDAEFLRKFNRSALKVVPWSFDGAVKHILGQDCNIDQLWREYQIAVGDIQP